MEIQSANNYKKPPMKNFLFYLGHILLIAFIISFMRGQTGINFILLPAAVVTYFIAFVKQDKRLRSEGEEIISQFNRSNLQPKFIGEMESPYIFVMKNNSAFIKTISLDPNNEKPGNDLDLEGLQLESGFPYVNIKSLLHQMQCKPRDYCLIEIFTSIQQKGMPVTYTNTEPDGKSTSGPLRDVEYNELFSSIYCNVDLKKGNKLDFSLLPNVEMVVKLYPYRKING